MAPREQGLRGRTLVGFCDELSRSSPAPGGGSVSALAGALGASLVSMVAALTHPGAAPAARAELERLGAAAQELKDRLLCAIDDDSAAFEGIRAARRLPKKTPEQQMEREAAILAATRRAIEVPLTVVELAGEAASQAERVAAIGLSAALSDAGVAAWCARTAAEGAALNVRINLPGLPDEDERQRTAARLQELLANVRAAADRAIGRVESSLA